MKNQTNEINIPQILQNQEQVVMAIQHAINDALLKHKQAGNPVCGWKDEKVIWISPEDIVVDAKTDPANK